VKFFFAGQDKVAKVSICLQPSQLQVAATKQLLQRDHRPNSETISFTFFSSLFSAFSFFFHPQNLERKEKHQATQLEQLTKKQIFLKWRCEQLISYNEALCKRRSVSECSTSTISSTNSYELTRSSSSICESGALNFHSLATSSARSRLMSADESQTTAAVLVLSHRSF
jgi:hypothetical protein